MHNLHRRGMSQRYSPAERLKIIMDNCGGQNKNNHVIRLAAYIVEMKYFRNVEFAFYVRVQVHSYHMALKILNSHTNVSMIDATQDMFKYYGNMLDSFYSNFELGTIRINHIFNIDMIDDTALEMQC
jgi:hypothetical protein